MKQMKTKVNDSTLKDIQPLGKNRKLWKIQPRKIDPIFFIGFKEEEDEPRKDVKSDKRDNE